MVECLWDSVVQSLWYPELAGLGLLFMLALCVCLGFDYCWVFLWWVLPSSWLTEGHSVHHVLYSVVQMWTVCVEADFSVCTRFWGFSFTLVQLFVLSNFSTILLYFQISPGLRLVWLLLPPSPSPFVTFWWFLCWWVSSCSRCSGVHSFQLVVWFFNVLYNFWSPILIYAGIHWLFALLLRRSARCFICTQGEVDSTLTYLTAVFSSHNSEWVL